MIWVFWPSSCQAQTRYDLCSCKRADPADPYTGVPPPPPRARATPLVGATIGVVSATFGTVEFATSFFWWPLNMKFFVSFGAGDGILGILMTVPPPTFIPSCPLEVEIGGSSGD